MVSAKLRIEGQTFELLSIALEESHLTVAKRRKKSPITPSVISFGVIGKPGDLPKTFRVELETPDSHVYEFVASLVDFRKHSASQSDRILLQPLTNPKLVGTTIKPDSQSCRRPTSA